MNLFRSEDHISGWLSARREGARPEGATIPVGQLCDLACAWYGDRLSTGWQPRSLEQSQAILDRVGLTGDFWRLV